MAHEILMSSGGVAKRLGVSLSTVRNLERAGVIPPAMRLEGSDRRCWRESDIVDVPRRPTQIRPTVGLEGPPEVAA